ncbi:MAG TPA: 23S rRNA (pseudouridine(1915)-N(3))-methyltransferase RlmH [Gemmatimonadaceae bacterium]
MKIRILTVGRPPAGPVRDAIVEYERRAARYWPLEITEVKAESARARASDEVRRIEGARLLDRMSGVAVILDERGRTMTSEVFAKWVADQRDRAQDVTFVIGGAYGLDEAVRSRATLLLAIAPWTLPHDLTRLVLAEQLYRAGTIVRGEPYHKA